MGGPYEKQVIIGDKLVHIMVRYLTEDLLQLCHSIGRDAAVIFVFNPSDGNIKEQISGSLDGLSRSNKNPNVSVTFVANCFKPRDPKAIQIISEAAIAYGGRFIELLNDGSPDQI